MSSSAPPGRNHAAPRDGAEQYLSMRELCARLGISRSTVYRQGLHAYGVLVGRVWRFDWSAIKQHLEAETDTEWPRGDGA